MPPADRQRPLYATARIASRHLGEQSVRGVRGFWQRSSLSGLRMHLRCRGKGTIYPAVGIGPAVFDAKYLAMVNDLSGVLIRVTGDRDPLCFRFAGGEGM